MTAFAHFRPSGGGTLIAAPGLNRRPVASSEGTHLCIYIEAVWRKEMLSHLHARRLKRACLYCATAWFGLILIMCM